MATDVREIVRNLSAFYDFTNRAVIGIGAGGGQLIEFARPARSVIAVDRDPAAMAKLAARLREAGMAQKFQLVTADLLDLRHSGDVVLFEFCLHQMAEPERALAHARTLAPEVVVIDHAPGSRWEWCAAEDEKVLDAWRAAERYGIRRQNSIEAWQTFGDYAALEARLVGQGAESVKRIACYRGQLDIRISMPYRLALL